MRLLTRIAVDTTPLRESRDLRLLLLGNVVTGLGTQATLVALPYQLYVETHSAFLVGLLGAAELIPLVTLALLGGALADRYDRRRLLLLDQVALVGLAAALAALAFVTKVFVALNAHVHSVTDLLYQFYAFAAPTFLGLMWIGSRTSDENGGGR